MPRASKTKKCEPLRDFVVDTNILVHDPYSYLNFSEHNVVIPMPVVEELDRLKSGNEFRSVSARQASRNLKELIVRGVKKGDSVSVPLGKGKGVLTFMELPKDSGKFCRDNFLEENADNRIIATAYSLQKEGANVTIVTKDNALLIKAKTLGINAEDYTHDMVRNPDQLTEKIKEIDPEDLQLPKGTIDFEPYFNQPVLVRGDGRDYIYRWQGKEFSPIHREEVGKTGIKSKNLEQDFAVDVLMDSSLSAIALIGSAGSGKTLLAIACAVSQKREYERILVARPAIELSNKTMGFLPGTLEEKYNPYLAPVRSACRLIMDKTEEKKKESDVEKWMDEQGIELLPLSMIRGDTFHHAFILVDEAQNLTPTEVKTIVSRAGEGTKIVFTGDINQIDVQYLTKETNGLSHLIDRFRGQRYFAFIEMQKSVRSPLAEAADKLL